MKAKILIAAAVVFLINSVAFAGSFTTADSVYYWFACRQIAEGPVIPEEMDSFSVEDQALAAIVFTVRGHYNRAGRILRYFEKLKKSARGDFAGFYTNYQLNGEPLSSEINPSNQLWLIIAAAHYTEYTGDKRFLKFARELAGAVARLEGPEGGLAAGFIGEGPIDFIRASDNILACSAMYGLWNVTQSSEYRFTAYRACQYLNVFLTEKASGNFYFSNVRKTNEPSNSLDALLVFEEKRQAWRNLPGELDFKNREKLALVYQLSGEQDKSEAILNDLASSLLFSKRHLGGAVMPSREKGSDYNLGISAWYIFASEGFNPFFQYPASWKDTDHYFQTFKRFSGDDFEGGLMKTLLVYNVKTLEGFTNKPRVDWTRDKETESGVLRVFLPEKPGKTSAKIVISRSFLEPQDFSAVTSIKFWVRGNPGASNSGSLQPSLKVGLGVIDGDGEIWVSKETSFVSRFRFVSGIQFFTGWTKSTDSPPGNGLLDSASIRELMFILMQSSDNPWDISIDNLSLE
ncbi:MAG: hypothetical protein ABII64_06320 [Elusimicrobiota bacterium]